MRDKRKFEETPSDDYYQKVEEGTSKRPACEACGDPVKIVFHSGGVPMAAKHCRECFAELRYGFVPKPNHKRRSL